MDRVEYKTPLEVQEYCESILNRGGFYKATYNPKGTLAIYQNEDLISIEVSGDSPSTMTFEVSFSIGSCMVVKYSKLHYTHLNSKALDTALDRITAAYTATRRVRRKLHLEFMELSNS